MKDYSLQIGQVFGYYRVESIEARDGRQWAICSCRCGTSRLPVRASSLVSGNSRSCGCLHREVTSQTHTKHGGAGSEEFKIWQNIIQRCHNPNRPCYSCYGGRGIVVADEWRRSFTAFLAHIGKRPSAKHSVDRINVDGHYEPGNVRWATYAEQSVNRRGNRRLTAHGKTQTMSQWSRELSIPVETIFYRLKKGASNEIALTVGKRLRWGGISR